MSAIAAVGDKSPAVRATNKRRRIKKRVEVVGHESSLDMKALFQTNETFYMRNGMALCRAYGSPDAFYLGIRYQENKN